MKRLLALLGAAAMIAAALYARSAFFPGKAAQDEANPTILVKMVCAEEIERYCRASVDRFLAAKPKVAEGRRVDVDLTTMDSADAAKAIGAGKISPLVWVPASTAYVDQVNSDWRARTGTDLFLKSGEYQVLPIAESPMVFLGPRDRLDILARSCGGALEWPCIREAVVKDGGWGALGGNPNWGLVKFGYANPVTTNEGLQALSLMSYGFYGKASDLTPGDITNPSYVQFIRDIGKSVDQFAETAADYERNLAIRCPGAYDVALAYEFVAATDISTLRGKECGLKAYYPSIDVKTDFPFAIAVTKKSTAIDKDAALKLRDYFYSVANQKEALRYGLRPTNPDVPLAGTSGNPLADNVGDTGGIQLQLPRAEVADYPSYDTVRTMLQTWQQKVEK